MMKFNLLHEDGYYLDRNKQGLSKLPGIYIVYKCDNNSQDDTVDIKEILYIGETENIFERHNSSTPHEHYDDFVKHAGGKDHICYGEILLPDVSEEERQIIEAALIHMQQPPINKTNQEHYNKPASEVTINGGPDCWESKHFIHPVDYGDELNNLE